MCDPTAISFREFEPADAAAFRRLNEEWIIRYFALEPKDEASLSDPQTTILDRGGRIFLAVRGGETIGCCALLRMGPAEFEVAKMAVTESCQGAGIGRRLLQQTIAAARAAGATRLYLETNRKLAPAIRLYESLGFEHIPADRVVPSPYARSNVAMELHLPPATGQAVPTTPDSAGSADAAPPTPPPHSPPPSSTF